MQEGLVLEQYVSESGEVLVSGGGALNEYFIERLKSYTPNHLNIIVPEKEIIEFKEAIVFALMGVLRQRNETNCLKSVTGASRDSSCGDIYEPDV